MEGTEMGRRWVRLLEDNIRDPCGNGDILYLDYINFSILTSIQYYHLQDISNRGNGVRFNFSVLFLIIAYESKITAN